MAETKSRREPNGLRPRPRPAADAPDAADAPAASYADDPPADSPNPADAAPPRPQHRPAEDDYRPGFDPEVNSRYEEIKQRGSTYITELQQMTMAQLLKAAK